MPSPGQQQQPLDDLFYDDPLDQRVVGVVKEALGRWAIPDEKINYAALRKRIENDGSIYGETMMQSRSISRDQLKDRFIRDKNLTGDDPVVDFGVIQLTIPNTTTAWDVTFGHRLGVVPKAVTFTGGTAPFGTYAGTVFIIGAANASTCQVFGYNWNGYASGVVVNVHYHMFG